MKILRDYRKNSKYPIVLKMTDKEAYSLTWCLFRAGYGAINSPEDPQILDELRVLINSRRYAP